LRGHELLIFGILKKILIYESLGTGKGFMFGKNEECSA
jgi:hypothetical protein